MLRVSSRAIHGAGQRPLLPFSSGFLPSFVPAPFPRRGEIMAISDPAFLSLQCPNPSEMPHSPKRGVALNRLLFVSGLCSLCMFSLSGCGHAVKLEDSKIEVRRNLFGSITITTPSGASISGEDVSFVCDESYVAGRISRKGAGSDYFLMNNKTGEILYFNTYEDINDALARLGYRRLLHQTLTDFESLVLRIGGKNKGELQRQELPLEEGAVR